MIGISIAVLILGLLWLLSVSVMLVRAERRTAVDAPLTLH